MSTSSSVPPGVTKRVPTLDMDEADWHRIIETNLTGTLRAYRAFVPTMIAQKQDA